MADKQTVTEASHTGISIRMLSIVMGIVAILLSGACLFSIQRFIRLYDDYGDATETYFECQNAANELSTASDFLTSEVRIYVATQQPEHITHYFEEVINDRRRDKAVEILTSHLKGTPAQQHLNDALKYSNKLKEREEYAMMLVIDATGIAIPPVASSLADIKLQNQHKAYSPEEKIDLAQEMVFDDTYQHYDDLIEQNVDLCKDDLLDRMGALRTEASSELDQAILRLEIYIILIVVDFLVTLVGFALLVLKPLYSFVRRIEQSEPLDDTGSSELRYLSNTYNMMYEESRRAHERLKLKSELDSLTGIYNREVFNRLLKDTSDKSVALLLIDVDNFKGVNDTYGHVVGDRVLQKVSQQLERTFRSSDFPCRIGGDEFAVIMMGVNATMQPVIIDKIRTIVSALLDTSDGLPAVTLSIGISFGPLTDTDNEHDSLYNRADQALYKVKDAGRNGHQFWDERDAGSEQTQA